MGFNAVERGAGDGVGEEGLGGLSFLAGAISSFFWGNRGGGFRNIQRRIFKSSGSEGGPAGASAALAPPPLRRSNSFRAMAQRFKCLATTRRSRAESRSSK